MVYADLEITGSHSADKATTQTVGHEMWFTYVSDNNTNYPSYSMKQQI